MGLDLSAPFFVVGCPRSGTTLVRTILDGHPAVAIPDESHFVVGLAPRPLRRRATLDDVLRHPRVQAWEVEPAALRRQAAQRPYETFAELVDVVFSAYAALQGKPRWGDKTPGYVTRLPMLARLFPTARFVHVIRDGREVAASLAAWSWGARSAVSGAHWWVHKVRAGRRAGERIGSRYAELRLEHLVARPEQEVRRLCAFLDLTFDPHLLDYPSRVSAAGPRPEQERHLVRPPTPGLRDWRAGLRPREVRAVEAVCRPLLDELSYASLPASRTARIDAVGVRLRDLVLDAPPALATRLRPARRSY